MEEEKLLLEERVKELTTSLEKALEQEKVHILYIYIFCVLHVGVFSVCMYLCVLCCVVCVHMSIHNYCANMVSLSCMYLYAEQKNNSLTSCAAYVV